MEKQLLPRRAWTPAERRVVWRGFLGRLFIAIEPIILSLVFAGLAIGMVILRPHREALVLSPIFACAVLAFVFYAIAVMIEPVRALLHTFSPIYVVDGYVRYRKSHPQDPRALAYVAVLDEEHQLLGEWPLGTDRIPDHIRPTLVEFSSYGGIHRLDGKSTGVLPAELPHLGIGATTPPHPRP
jgi:hypothetical protein